MRVKFRIGFPLLLAFFVSTALADSYNIGIVAYNLTNATGSSPGTAEFDITNETGVNSSAPDFPVADTLTFQNLSLEVFFSNSTTQTFSLGTGTPLFSTSEQITSATLTGTLSPTTAVNVEGVGAVNLLPSFTATIMPLSGLYLNPGDPSTLGDFAIIQAQTQPSSSVPEPAAGVLLMTGFFAFSVLNRRIRSHR